MARVEPRHLIYLDDFVDPATVDIVDLGAVLSLSLKSGAGDSVYGALALVPHLRTYRKEDMARYHYGNHHRTPEIVALADEGWLVTTRGVASIRSRLTRGAHGHAPEAPSMQAIFLARGPAFRKGFVVPSFQNIHLYALLAHILGVTPGPNDGSLDSVRSVLVN
jgi:hypothetical protein